MLLTLDKPTAAATATTAASVRAGSRTGQYRAALMGRLISLTRIFAVATGNGALCGAIAFHCNPSRTGATLVAAAVTALTLVALVLLKARPVNDPGDSDSIHF